MLIPLSVPNLDGNEKEYLNQCIDTTFVSSVGEYVNRFEQMVAEASGSEIAVATSSGTTGLHAALTAAGVKHGELVIIPSFTFIASANSISHCGAIPWLMDISRDDWCLSPDIVQDEIKSKCDFSNGELIHKPSGRRVAAIMPVYTLGNIPNMERFREIADHYMLPIVSDAACAIGARRNKEELGKLADLSVLSFNGNKTVTCGGGGAVLGSREDLLGLVRHMTTTARVWPDYDFDMVGFNYRMTNLQAAVGCAQMERLESFLRIKKQVREYYSAFNEIGIETFPTIEGASCWLSGIVLPEGVKLENTKEFCSALKERDIDAKPFWKPVHLQKPYENAPKGSMDVSDSLWQRVVTLPCSTNISVDDCERVYKEVKDIYSRYSHSSFSIR